MFQTLHVFFQQQYTELWNALDLIAERIRSLGHYAPGSFQRFSELASIAEEHGVPSARDMIPNWWKARKPPALREVFKIADAANDCPLQTCFTQRMEIHEKNAWMLRSRWKMAQKAFLHPLAKERTNKQLRQKQNATISWRFILQIRPRHYFRRQVVPCGPSSTTPAASSSPRTGPIRQNSCRPRGLARCNQGFNLRRAQAIFRC